MTNSNLTNDKQIRVAFKESLKNIHKDENKTQIIEELGVKHGAARVDIAVVNGEIHGYELKSDLDTLYRLSEQMKVYNAVFDRITLVVGKTHVHKAIKIIPEWWGIIIAKTIESSNSIDFFNIREPDENPYRDSISIAELLWRQEALDVLEKRGLANGVRSKPKRKIYERLAKFLNQDTLRKEVRECLFARTDWRSEKSRILNGD